MNTPLGTFFSFSIDTLWRRTGALAAGVMSATIASSHAQYGDVTDEMIALGNPLVDAGVPRNTREMRCIRLFDGKIYLGYGHSRGAQATKVVWLDPKTNETGEDEVSFDIRLEEQTRLRIMEDKLFIHSYDFTSGSAFYMTKEVGGEWEKVTVNGGGDHSRDMISFDGKIFWQFRTGASTTNYPGMRQASAANPSSNFSKITRPEPSGFEKADAFSAREYFTFEGKLYTGHTQITEVVPQVPGFPAFTGNYGKIPYILSYDPDSGTSWEVSHGVPDDLIAAADLPLNNRFAWHPTSPIEVATSEGPRLLFSTSHRNSGNPESKKNNRLYVSDSFSSGNLASYIALPGIPEDIDMAHVGLIKREGRVFAMSVRDPIFSGHEVWVHQAIDFTALEDPASWVEVCRFTKRFIGAASDINLYQNGTFEYADGRFFFAETAYVPDSNDKLNRDNGGRIWGIDAEPMAPPFKGLHYTNLKEWRNAYGLAADGSEDLGTPAGDGIENILKFAFGLEPPASAFSAAQEGVGIGGLPQIGADDGNSRFTFVRRRADSAPGIDYTVMGSSTMAAWAPLTGASPDVERIDSIWERVSYDLPADHSRYFFAVGCTKVEN